MEQLKWSIPGSSIENTKDTTVADSKDTLYNQIIFKNYDL